MTDPVDLSDGQLDVDGVLELVVLRCAGPGSGKRDG